MARGRRGQGRRANEASEDKQSFLLMINPLQGFTRWKNGLQVPTSTAVDEKSLFASFIGLTH